MNSFIPIIFIKKIFWFARDRLRYCRDFWKNYFWFWAHPLSLINILINIKKSTNVRGSFFGFVSKMFYLQYRLDNPSFRHLINQNIHYVGTDNFTRIKNSGRPVLAVFWNHPSYLIHDHLLDVHQDFLGVTSHDFQRSNMLLVKNDDKFLPYRMYQLLVNNKFIALAFDGGYGNLTIQTKILGSEIFLSKTYPFLVKQLKPIVLPFFTAIESNGTSQYIYGEQLFTDEEMDRLTQTEILDKTIDYFTKSLVAHGAHQVNIKWFFNRLRQRP